MGETTAATLAATASDVVAGIENVANSATSNFTIETIGSILAVSLAAAAALFLFWWGGRKVVRMVKNAFTKGRLSL